MKQPNNTCQKDCQIDRRKFLKASSVFLAVAAVAGSPATSRAEGTRLDPNPQTPETVAPISRAGEQRSWGAGWMTF